MTMATITQLPSGTWRAEIRRKNLPRETKTFPTEQAARAWASTREKTLIFAREEMNPGKVAIKRILFEDLAEEYFASQVFKQKAARTRETEENAIKPIMRWFKGMAADDISGATIQRYLDDRANTVVRDNAGQPIKVRDLNTGKMVDRLISGDTVRLNKALLSNIFKFASLRHLVAINPMQNKFQLPPLNKREARISVDEQAAIFAYAAQMATHHRTNKSLMPYLHYLFETGSRPGEAARVQLAWCKLSDERAKISIPRSGSKTGEPRVVMLTKALTSILKYQAKKAKDAGSPYLFWSYSPSKQVSGKRNRYTKEESLARPIIPYDYYHPWCRVLEKAGVPKDAVPHSTRHEYISRIYENPNLNLSDGQIAGLVGDVNALSLERYRHLRVEALRETNEAHLASLREAVESASLKMALKTNDVLRGAFEEARAKLVASGEWAPEFDKVGDVLNRAMLDAEATQTKGDVKKAS